MDVQMILLSQYPALLLLSLYCLFAYLRVHNRSAAKSVTAIILFGLLLAASLVCCALGIHEKYWSFKTLVPIRGWSWVGIILVLVLTAGWIVRRSETKANRRKLERAVAKAEQDKAEAIERAREEGAAAERAKAGTSQVSAAAQETRET